MNEKKTKLIFYLVLLFSVFLFGFIIFCIFIWFFTGSVAGSGLQGVLPTKGEARSVDFRLDESLLFALEHRLCLGRRIVLLRRGGTLAGTNPRHPCCFLVLGGRC